MPVQQVLHGVKQGRQGHQNGDTSPSQRRKTAKPGPTHHQQVAERAITQQQRTVEPDAKQQRDEIDRKLNIPSATSG